MGDWTANPDRRRYGCADGIRNDQLYGLRARDILNHQLKREGCAEGMALSFWCEKVAKVAKLQVALRFFLFFLHIVSRIFRKKHYLCSKLFE